MQVKVFKVSDSTVRIERYENNIQVNSNAYPALLWAQYNLINNLVSIQSSEIEGFEAISTNPGNIEVNGVWQTDGEAAADLLNSFLGNFNSGGASSSTTDIVLSVIKSGINGEITPSVFSWITGLSVKEVRLTSNAAGISFKIGNNTYDAETIIDVKIPAGTELLITDVEIEAGNNQANVIIIFKKLTS